MGTFQYPFSRASSTSHGFFRQHPCSATKKFPHPLRSTSPKRGYLWKSLLWHGDPALRSMRVSTRRKTNRNEAQTSVADDYTHAYESPNLQPTRIHKASIPWGIRQEAQLRVLDS
eukprot:1342897-Amorphochlora_amoeboformis.AAC.1